MQMKKYEYATRPDLLPVDWDATLPGSVVSEALEAAGVDPEDQEIGCGVLTQAWRGHSAGAIVVSGDTQEGLPFWVASLELTDISDGDLRGDASLPHLYAAQDGRQLTEAEQAAAGVGDEERIYWLDSSGADTSVLPTPDALHQGASGYLAATLAAAGVDPEVIRWDDVHYAYRREPPEEIAIEARGHTARLRQGGIVEIDAPDQRAGTGYWYDGGIRDCAACLEDEIYAALDDALQAALAELDPDVQELFEFRRD